MIDTQLSLRGFQLWAWEPHHYRHGHAFGLLSPERFPTEIREREVGAGTQIHWTDYEIGFVRPDGSWRDLYCGFKSQAEAESFRSRNADAAEARLGAEVRVGFKRTDDDGNYLRYEFCDADEPGAKAWGMVGTGMTESDDYPPLQFDLTPEEAALVLDWGRKADAAWFAAHPDFLPREERLLQAQVAGLSPTAAEFLDDAVNAFGADAVAALTGAEGRDLLECFECGATYDEPGHVEQGGMSCGRCG